MGETGPPGTGRVTAEPAIPPLNSLYLYLTQGCNLACQHCWLAPRFDPDGTREPTLELDLAVRAMDQAIPLGLQRVKLTGGEPLLHPRIAELLGSVRERELKLILETNGVLCTPEVACAIAGFPQHDVAVSLDGADAATNDTIRGVQGSFDRSIRGIRTLVDAGTAPQIILCLMRSNAGQVQRLIELAESLGAASVKLNVLQPTARGNRLYQRKLALEVPEILEIQRLIEDTIAPDAGLKVILDTPPAFHALGKIAIGEGANQCGILGVLGVLATGHYALCGIGSHIPELVFGRVASDPLAGVWSSHPVLVELRSGLPDRLAGICGQCLMKTRCLGSCVAQNYYRKHSLFAPYWFCEQAHRLGLFPASRLAPGSTLDPDIAFGPTPGAGQ